MRMGWFRSVHCKSLPAQETRSLLGARKLLQGKLHDIELSLRGTLRGFGLKVGKTTPKTFEARIRTLVADHPTLTLIAEALLRARAVLLDEFIKLDKKVHALARQDPRARLLTTAPGVGSMVALTYAAAIDDPARFRSSKTVGALFGLTPKKYQSGETDITGRISKTGDAAVRTALYEAANTIPGKFWCFSQRLNVRFAFACRVGRRAKCCAASEVPWTDRSGVEEFDVHPAKSCKTKSAPGHALVTAAHGGILQGLNCEPRGGWQTRLCRRRLDHQPGIGTEAADATRFVHERPPRRAALVHDLVNVAIEPMGERSTFEEAPYALRRT